MALGELTKEVEGTKGVIGERVRQRMKEFKERGKNECSVKKELCFCLLTANYDAEKAIKIQSEIDDGFVELPQEELSSRLRELGYRYPNKRSEYIVASRDCSVTGRLQLPEEELREWLVKNIKGLGFKEASHFMRNIGFENVAIIDFHIIDLLVKHKVIERPKTLTPKKYLEIESVLLDLAKRCSVSLAELDLYLWYLETGKVLK